ncbi:MAG: transglutaminase TgpA family protein [Terriglobales bacterium]
MPASSAQLRPALPIAIDRYFEISLYLLVLTGLGTLASTGTLGILTVILVGTALIVRGYLLAERRTWVVPERWTSFLTIGYAVFYLADYFLISRGFLDSTVHLVLFVMVVRLFAAQRDRDNYLLMVISFLMVLAGAVLTVDSIFLVTFTAFLFTAIVTCILMEMKHAAARATYQSANPVYRMAHRRMVFSLVRIVPALVVLIGLGGAVIFFLLPRGSAGYLGTFAEGTSLSTGFSDHVELGGIGQIQQSNAVVMHISIDGDKSGGMDLKWRGISLNVFDGTTWSDSHEKYVTPGQPGGTFLLNAPGDRLDLLNAAAAVRTIHYRVLMDPVGAGVFFLAPTAESLQGYYRLITRDSGGAVFNEDAEHPISEYEATSDIGSPSAFLLRASGDSYPEQIIAEYVQTPVLDPRIPELAKQVTADKQNNYDRAVAIEEYLRSHFGYTLQLSPTRPRDPLADFLFVRKRGHCEYFASSMAIMLRTLGIPSRVVNGFRTGEFNDLTSQYVMRERDAHSWVEAYFPGYGWVSFDPTPVGTVESRASWSRAMLYLDAMSSFWREWVVSYDASHQSSLGRIATQGSIQYFQRIRRWGLREYRLMLSAARSAQTNLAEGPVRWGFAGLLSAIALGLGAAVIRWPGFFRRASLRANPARFPRDAAAIWYQRMVRRLARKGLRKLPSQTPAEFLASIEDGTTRRRVEKFTTFYERARFGGSSEDAEALPQLYEEIYVADEKNKSLGMQ